MPRKAARDAPGLKAPDCPVHELAAVLVGNVEVFGPGTPEPDGRTWRCEVDGCDMRVGAHPDGTPMGRMAGAALRRARRRAHKVFDAWWKARGLKRNRAYEDLTLRFGLPEAHIGGMGHPQCKAIAEIYGADPDPVPRPHRR